MQRPAKEKQGIVPDLLIGTGLCKAKGTRPGSTHTHTRINGAAKQTS
jgi:hypothetical protein